MPNRALKTFGMASALLALAAGLWAAEDASPERSSSEIFEALRARIASAAAEGRLPAETGAAAEELAFALRREQIRSDAEIEVRKLEAARFTGAEQEEALAGLVQAAAARERRWCQAIRQLEELAATPAPEEAQQQEGEGKKKGGLGIAFEPADLINDPDG